MTNSVLMSLGTQAMSAAYAQLTTVGHNIANANTPGYSRQRVLQSNVEGQYTGSGYFGRGVTVDTVQRASNIFLTQQAGAAQSSAAADGAQRDMLQQLEKILGSGNTGLGNAATQLFNSFADLASAPADLSARQAVLARAEDLSSMSRSYSDQVEFLQSNVFQDVKNSAAEVNKLAAQVAQVNEKIAGALGTGQTPNDLLDQRDQLISQISDKIQVYTVNASDGSMSVFVAGGQSLVLSNRSNTLVARPDEYDPSRVGLDIAVAGQKVPLAADLLGGGSLAGLLRFQNEDLTEARNRIGLLSAALSVQMNTQQSHGIDLLGAAGQPLFGYGKPQAMPAASNASTGGVFDARIDLAVTDPTALQATEYELDNDPANPGQMRVTRLSDQKVFSNVASGDVIDGFSINLTAGPLGGNDRFLLQPVSRAAGDMHLMVGNPRAVAAGSPVTAVAAAANTGTATVSLLNVVDAPTLPYAPLSLQFTTAAGDYQILDAGNAVVANGTWSADVPINYNGFALHLKGTPALGDKFSIAPTTFPSASNGNALAFDQLANKHLVEGQTYSDAYAQVLSGIGLRVQGAVGAADTSSTVAARATEALKSETGVNLDEEAAALIQYQQAYQAAAKMMQTAQTVLDTMLQLGH